MLAEPTAGGCLVVLCCLRVRGNPQKCLGIRSFAYRAQGLPRYVLRPPLRTRAWWGTSIALEASEFGVFIYPAIPMPLGTKEAPPHNSLPASSLRPASQDSVGKSLVLSSKYRHFPLNLRNENQFHEIRGSV